jgi:formate hydrogenlyase subunit 4
MDFLSHFAIFGLSSAYAHWHLKQILTTKNKGPGMFKLHAIFGFAALFVLAIYVTKATTDKWKSPPSTPAANS